MANFAKLQTGYGPALVNVDNIDYFTSDRSDTVIRFAGGHELWVSGSLEEVEQAIAKAELPRVYVTGLQ